MELAEAVQRRSRQNIFGYQSRIRSHLDEASSPRASSESPPIRSLRFSAAPVMNDKMRCVSMVSTADSEALNGAAGDCNADSRGRCALP